VSIIASVAALAQEVPPPPRPQDDVSILEVRAKSLQDQLNSIGRISWTETTTNTLTGKVSGPGPKFEELTRATIIPRNCEIRTAFKASSGEADSTLFLEEMDTVEVLSSQEYQNRQGGLVKYSMSPSPISVAVPGGDVKVRDRETANQIADGFRQLARECKAVPRPIASGPTLAQTFDFIGDKVKQAGAVSWMATPQDTIAGTTGAPLHRLFQVSKVTADPGNCRMTFSTRNVSAGIVLFDGDTTVAFRRVEKFSVVGMQDSVNREYARQGKPHLTETVTPSVFALLIAGGAGREFFLPFADEDLANRVAKAMLHAVELCGGGSKDPF